WHAMTGMVGERVSDMAAKFNASQSDYIVNAVQKGSYADTLNAAIAAYQAKQPPHIVQVADRGTQRMLSSGSVYPVYQLMKDRAVALDWNDLIGPLKSYYSTGGHTHSKALTQAPAILYYYKAQCKMAGLPDKAPTTWDEVEAMAKKLKAAGVKCPFGSAWPSFVLVEAMHGYHDHPFADQSNGFDGLATSLKINGPFGVKLMELLARGAKEGWFTYGGAGDQGHGALVPRPRA